MFAHPNGTQKLSVVLCRPITIYYLKMLFAKLAPTAAFVMVSMMQATPAGAVCASGQMGTPVLCAQSYNDRTSFAAVGSEFVCLVPSNSTLAVHSLSRFGWFSLAPNRESAARCTSGAPD
jgi:hypothetical protein